MTAIRTAAPLAACLALFGALFAHTPECARTVLLQLPPPAVQFTGMHLQAAGDLGHALSTVQARHRLLLELFAEFSSRLHLSVSPFNDFQGLTGCLKNGVHSTDPISLFMKALFSVRISSD